MVFASFQSSLIKKWTSLWFKEDRCDFFWCQTNTDSYRRKPECGFKHFPHHIRFKNNFWLRPSCSQSKETSKCGIYDYTFTEMYPDISKLCERRQAHPSRWTVGHTTCWFLSVKLCHLSFVLPSRRGDDDVMPKVIMARWDRKYWETLQYINSHLKDRLDVDKKCGREYQNKAFQGRTFHFMRGSVSHTLVEKSKSLPSLLAKYVWKNKQSRTFVEVEPPCFHRPLFNSSLRHENALYCIRLNIMAEEWRLSRNGHKAIM